MLINHDHVLKNLDIPGITYLRLHQFWQLIWNQLQVRLLLSH